MKAGTAQRVAFNLLSTLVMTWSMSKQSMPSLLGAAKIYCDGLAAAAKKSSATRCNAPGGNLKKAMLIPQGCKPDEAVLFWNRPAGVCEPRCGLQEAPLKDG